MSIPFRKWVPSLPSAAPLAGSEQLASVQAGISANLTVANIRDYLFGTATVVGTITFPNNGTNTISAQAGSAAGIVIEATAFLSFGAEKIYFANLTPTAPFDTRTINMGNTSTNWEDAYNTTLGAFLNVVDPYGTGAASFAMRTSDWRTGSVNPAMINLTTVYDAAIGESVWGVFQVAWKTATPNDGGLLLSYELSVVNLGSSVAGDPYTINPANSTYGIRIDSGDGAGGPTTTNAVTNALDIINNPGTSGGGTFNAGIRFGNGAFTLQGGYYQAIQFAHDFSLVWYGSASTIVGALSFNSSGLATLTTLLGLNVNAAVRADAGSAPAATAALAYNMSSTAGLGIYYSSGTPSVVAPAGSLCLDTSGKLWFNAAGTGTWTQITIP